MRAVIAALLTGVAVETAHAAAPVNPRAVEEQIRNQGATATVDSLDHDGRMDQVLEAIGRGDSRWVALAPLLAPGADGSDSEGIGIELARALPANPAAVLRVLQPGDGVTGIQRVCALPFIESTSAADAAYRQRATKAVTRITQPDLLAARNDCLARLRS